MKTERRFPSTPLAWLALIASAAMLASAGCSSTPNVTKYPVYKEEKFATVSPFSRSYPATSEETCEAARRALLSQGYVVDRIQPDSVDARKNFQPDAMVHVEVQFHVICSADRNESNTTTAFVNALQDSYALKKTSNSASLGVGPVGSVSLPFSSSNDSLVKVASETIPAGEFYDRFFTLVEFYLVQRPHSGGEVEPAKRAASSCDDTAKPTGTDAQR